jgi:hypothetical protein
MNASVSAIQACVLPKETSMRAVEASWRATRLQPCLCSHGTSGAHMLLLNPDLSDKSTQNNMHVEPLTWVLVLLAVPAVRSAAHLHSLLPGSCPVVWLVFQALMADSRAL